MTCKTIRPKTIKVCVGSMRQKIKINVRTLTPPTDNGVDFGETLSGTKEVWAAIKTSRGIEVFDGTNLIGVATHLFYIRALKGQTSESWLEFKGSYYRILDVQDFQEAGRFQVLRCVVRGDTSKPVNLS